jgi:hypothetical protein
VCQTRPCLAVALLHASSYMNTILLCMFSTEFGRIGRTRPIEQPPSTIQRAIPVIEVLQPMQEQAVATSVTSNSERPQHEAVTVAMVAPTAAPAVLPERNSMAENSTSSSNSSSSSSNVSDAKPPE